MSGSVSECLSQSGLRSASLLPSTVLLKFRTDRGRDPRCDAFSEDSELLLQIRDDVLGALGVDPALLPADFVRSVSARVPPAAQAGDARAQHRPRAGKRLLCCICHLCRPLPPRWHSNSVKNRAEQVLFV